MNATAAAVPGAAPLSQGARIVNTFIAPSKTFADLRRSAAWWAPYLLLFVSTLLFAYVVDQKIGFHQVVDNQIQASPKATQRMEQMPPDQRTKTFEGQVMGTRYFTYGFQIFLLVFYLIFAGIYLATFKFGAGADITFKVSLAIVVLCRASAGVKGIAGYRVDHGRGECRIVHAAESGGDQSWLFFKSSGFSVFVRSGVGTRHIRDLDSGAHGYRLFGCRQGEAFHGDVYSLWMVRRDHAFLFGPGCNGVLMCV